MQNTHRNLACALAFFTITVATDATATTTIDNGAIALNPTFGWAEAAQSFIVPTMDNILSEWTFGLEGSGTSYKFSITKMSGGLPDVGQTLFSVTNPWGIGPQVISGINLTLTSGDQYAAVVDFLGYTGLSIVYGDDGYVGGNGYWGSVSGTNDWTAFPGLDLGFTATFAAGNTVPEAPSAALALLGIAALVREMRNRSGKRCRLVA